MPTPAAPSKFKCTECPEEFESVDQLAPHLERHREVQPPTIDPKTGKTTSEACPKKCGRNFLRPSEYRDHSRVCDGQPPIPKAEPVTPAEKRISEVRRLEAEAIRTMTKDAEHGKPGRKPAQPLEKEKPTETRAVLDLGFLKRRRENKGAVVAELKKCPACGEMVKDFRGHRKCPAKKGGSSSGSAPASSGGTAERAIKNAALVLRTEADALRAKAEKLEDMALKLEEMEA